MPLQLWHNTEHGSILGSTEDLKRTMSDLQYLDAFISLQTDVAHLKLLNSFRDMCRKPEVPESDYATELRRQLDQLLIEVAHETPGTDNQ
jgi:hypothetical protein